MLVLKKAAYHYNPTQCVDSPEPNHCYSLVVGFAHGSPRDDSCLERRETVQYRRSSLRRSGHRPPVFLPLIGVGDLCRPIVNTLTGWCHEQ